MAEAGVIKGVAATEVCVGKARLGAVYGAKDGELRGGLEQRNENILGKDCLRWRDAAETAAARARTAKKRMVSERVRMGVERCGAVGAQRRSVGSWRR